MYHLIGLYSHSVETVLAVNGPARNCRDLGICASYASCSDRYRYLEISTLRTMLDKGKDEWLHYSRALGFHSATA